LSHSFQGMHPPMAVCLPIF